MKRQYFLCVEIPQRPSFQQKQVAPSPPSSSSCLTKRRKLNLPNSPTVSDFEAEGADNYSRCSPTVSDFISSNDLDTLAPLDDDTPTASGSNVTLEGLKLSHDAKFHAASVNEIPEDEAIIYSETPPENIEEQQDDVPVRVLDDFAVFDVSSNELVPIAQLYYQNSRTFSASGLVRAYVCDQGNEDEEDSEDDEKNSRIRLSTILKFDVHSISEETGDLDSKIYLQTKHAWYILSIPSQQYKPFYAPFWIQHRVLHALVNLVLRNPQATFEEFTESFSDVNGDESARENAIASVHVLGRVITEADIQSDDVKAYATALFPDICGQDYGLDIRRVNLATEYLDLDLDDYLAQKGKPRRQRKFSSDEEQEVLKHNTSTFVTPKVSQIMRNLFSVPLDVAEIPEIEDDTDIIAQIDNLVAHHEDPTSMKWGAKENGLYRSIIMDGVEYCVGDEVMVSPGTDENGKAAQVSKTDACQSPNTYANRLWFCKICYFFEKVVDGKKIKMFHHQWLTHGSKTILQETAHSKSLFLLDGCDDNPVAAIFKKCNVTWLKPEDKELPDDGAPNSNDFHCSLIYDEADAHFIDLPSDEEMSDLLQGEKPCLSCAMRKQREQLDDPVVFADGYLRHGISYHVHDFVYLRLGKETAGLLEIGQITKLGSPQALDEFKITVRLLSRYERQDCSELELLWDERRLYFTDRVHAIDYQQIEGKCYIQLLTKIEEIEKWVRHDNHYYVNQQLDARRGRLYGMEQGSLDCCDICNKERMREEEDKVKLLNRNGRIRCLELFSGAGGLGTGLDLSGFVETKYAVEFSPSAAATYARNHPQTTVYCEDSNNLLKQAYDASKGDEPKPLKSGIDGKLLPLMPKRGEVDMISGGPPCQSFSGANHNPRPDDVRSTLPGNMLSYVELYNPQYFLLENVIGLLKYRLMSTRSKTKRSLVGGIEAGMVKFIMRTLIALGYQVRCKVLQAGQYGAPQSRRRAIFWGAKRGVTIPDYPLPMYAFERGMNRFKFATFTMEPLSRNPDDNHQCAPLPAVTVNDAVGDLPPFDWVNPHLIIHATKADKKEVQERINNGIAQFSAVANKNTPPAGFAEGAEYLSEPQNRYQQWLRGKMKDGEEVEAHYTQCFSAKIVEATTSVPIKPNATHNDIPLCLLSERFCQGKTIKGAQSSYGRLDGDSQFRCALTSASPNTKASWILHPNQKRVLSVREHARSQGFPDHYVFLSMDKSITKTVVNQIRQIGNAVPVPLALHLGKALGEALLKDLVKEEKKKEREGSPVV